MDESPGITVHVSDDTFVAAAPAAVAAAVAQPAHWAAWWPDLELSTTKDRGIKGRQWLVSGPLHGTAEIWLEPWRDGTVLHLYLRLDFPRDTSGRRAERERERRVLTWKRDANALKDDLEAGRAPGTPAVAGPAGGG